MNNLLTGSFRVAPGPHDGDSVAIRIPGPSSPAQDLTAFKAEVAEVERALQLQEALIVDIKSMHEESKHTVKDATVKDLAQRIQGGIQNASQMALPIKGKIEDLQRSNEKNRSYPEAAKGTPSDQQRTNLTNLLIRKLKANVKKLTELRDSIEAEQRAIIARRIRVVTGKDLPAADLESILRNGLGDEVLQAAVAQQGSSTTAAVRAVLEEVEERSAAVKDISKELEELNQIVAVLATLVVEQGVTLDGVEVAVEVSQVDIERAKQELEKARRDQLSRRKCVTVGVLLSIALLIILVVILLVVLKQLGIL